MKKLFVLITFLLGLCAAFVAAPQEASAQLPTVVKSLTDTTQASFNSIKFVTGTNNRVPFTLMAKLESTVATDYLMLAYRRDTSATQVIYIYGGATAPTIITNFVADTIRVKGSATGLRFTLHAIKPF